MEQKITFKINAEDKELVVIEAERNRLSVSALCRFIILKNIRKNEGDIKK